MMLLRKEVRRRNHDKDTVNKARQEDTEKEKDKEEMM